MKSFLVGIVVLLGLTSVAGAQVSDVSWINPHWVGLSGYYGIGEICEIGDDAYLADRDIEYALTGIDIKEVNNKGNELRLYGREMGINSSENPLVGYDNLPGYTGIGSRNAVQLGTDYYIRGLRACVNLSTQRLKGLQIYSAFVDDVNYVSIPFVTDLWVQPNCDYWAGTVMCPEGEVAVAVKMQHVSAAFVGIELQCAEVVW